MILEKGPHPTSVVLQLELALMQIGNSVAPIFDRSIEGKPDPKGRYASAFVGGRNDCAYRQDRIAEASPPPLHRGDEGVQRTL